MMLEIVDGYSRDFKMKFGGDKSKVMVINGDETDRDSEWNIGEVKIGRTEEYKYLGCMLSEDGCARAKGEKVCSIYRINCLTLLLPIGYTYSLFRAIRASLVMRLQMKQQKCPFAAVPHPNAVLL
ncbi:hypothetical protein FHG87_024613 [Trinorchestia longiramus]|nr:hypothetical protein FHG87_024613 [Trinorchestia longiramus]